MSEIQKVGNVNGQVVIPRDFAMGGVLVGIPSFGMWSVEFANNLLQQSPPINFSMVYMTPKYTRWDWEKNEPKAEPHPVLGRQIPVDEARNIIAHTAIANNFAYVFFRDDDVITKPETINRLYARQAPIIAAPYWSKQQPPHSLILLDGKLAGWEDFKYGELVECMATGMGATLIETRLFEEIEPPWFKTVHGLDMNDIQDIAPNCGRMTEDVYFCKKAAAKGYKVLCDTAVPAIHQDFKSDTYYSYNEGLGVPGWQVGSSPAFFFIPKHDYKLPEPPADAPKPEVIDAPVKLDMGAGAGVHEGWTRVDMNPAHNPDLVADMRDVATIQARYPNVDAIRCREAFEHLDPSSHVQCLTAWRRLLKPGGTLEIQVPDLIWCCNHVIEHAEDDFTNAYNAVARVYGHVSDGPLQRHQWGFTENMLRTLIENAGFSPVEITRHEGREGNNPDGTLYQVSLIATAVATDTGLTVAPESLVLEEANA